MKTLLALFTLLLPVEASPFLVCDPYPVAGIDPSLIPVSFNITGIGANPISVQAFTLPDGTKILHYDVGPLPNGSYTVIATAVNAFAGESSASAPFTFGRGTPSQPTGLHLSPN